MTERATVPRGRHAPPLEVRLSVQRQRLFDAAAAVFARHGYADATAESIAREAGMSKATFYEHFANKEECILSLFDETAADVLRAMREAADAAGDDALARFRAGLRVFLDVVAGNPALSQTLLVEIVGVGKRGAERRDRIVDGFARAIDAENAANAAAGTSPRFASPDDALAVVGAVVELVSRKVRLSRPGEVRALQPVVERLVFGLLAACTPE